MKSAGRRLHDDARFFWVLAAAGALVTLAGLVAAHYMEEHGHVVTGMNNQIVWGMPHVFAIFMIVAASGVLNVASIGTVFSKAAYKPSAPLSGLLCLALLAGGLFVLMLDLGRPDRLVVAATHYNATSVFAWNVLLYSGMYAIVAVYLWTLMERRMAGYAKAAGIAAFAWRIILTTGTGAIFAFLVARQAYGSALLPPMFIVLSFAWGLAVFLVVQPVVLGWSGKTPSPELVDRMRRLLGLFVIGALYFVFVYHLVNAYFARQQTFEQFLLVEGGIYPAALLGRLCRGRKRRPARPALGAAVWRRARDAFRRAARDPGRVRVALYIHHRRTGVSAGDLPRLCGIEQFRRRSDPVVPAEPAGDRARRRRDWALPS